MKLVIFLMCLSAFSVFARTISDPNGVLPKLDAFLGAANFTEAFHFNDYQMVENSNCSSGSEETCQSLYSIARVVQVTEDDATIASVNLDGSEEFSQLKRSDYERAQGNPLRLFEILNQIAIQSMKLTWTSIREVKVDYLGRVMPAVEVKGEIELCEANDCSVFPVSAEVVKGVPFLAMMKNITLDLKVAKSSFDVRLFERH